MSTLFYGLREDKINDVEKFYEFEGCNTCDLNRIEHKCWKNECPRDRKNHKIDFQHICLEIYEKENLFPPAFSNLAKEIDSHKEGEIKELSIK